MPEPSLFRKDEWDEIHPSQSPVLLESLSYVHLCHTQIFKKL